ncbi:hypothetical protein NDU88_000445 [Pleurodeles waltl]|uniref:Uncharacterized protein n=1 Tax=Pleurodeles waltl TaxID=8319 RepID=A0AAV7URP7_PLEWA|nr:hypothetical protein NDU88_000445 [Pleurodeles waltl]
MVFAAMSSEDKVQAALRLLTEAGRLDMLKEGVIGPSRPARRASSGVVAVVLACSPPRALAVRQAVSGRGRCWGGVGCVAAKGRRRASPTRRASPHEALKTHRAGPRLQGSSSGCTCALGTSGWSILVPAARCPMIAPGPSVFERVFPADTAGSRAASPGSCPRAAWRQGS